VVSVSELFPGAVSFADETEAVFVRSCSVAGAVTETVMAGATELAVIAARVQVIVVEPEQLQPVPEAEPVIPAGSGSETLTEDAGWAELFVTTRE
jgi:hypothetical protein